MASNENHQKRYILAYLKKKAEVYTFLIRSISVNAFTSWFKIKHCVNQDVKPTLQSVWFQLAVDVIVHFHERSTKTCA